MRDRRRLHQYLHVKETIKLAIEMGKNPASMTFARLKTLIVNGLRVMEGVSPGRYTAMVKSVANEHMNDEDVTWH